MIYKANIYYLKVANLMGINRAALGNSCLPGQLCYQKPPSKKNLNLNKHYSLPPSSTGFPSLSTARVPEWKKRPTLKYPA